MKEQKEQSASGPKAPKGGKEPLMQLRGRKKELDCNQCVFLTNGSPLVHRSPHELSARHQAHNAQDSLAIPRGRAGVKGQTGGRSFTQTWFGTRPPPPPMLDLSFAVFAAVGRGISLTFHDTGVQLLAEKGSRER